MKKFNIIKSSRKKSKVIDEKIEYLNKECQKTGLNEITMGTSGVYQGSTTNPNAKYQEFTAINFNGYPLAMSGDGNLGQQSTGGASIRASDGAAMSPPHPSTGQIRVASTKGGIDPMFKIAVPGEKPTPQHRMTGPILWWYNSSYNGGQGRWQTLEYNAPGVHGNGVYPGNRAGWGYWGSDFMGFPLLRDDEQYADLFNALNDINGNQFNPDDIGTPTTTIYFQNDLGDPGFLPIDVMSPQAYETILDKARRNQIAAEYPRKDPLDRMIDFLDKEIKNKPWPGKDPEDPFKFSQGHQTSSYKPEGDLLSEAIKLGHFEPEVLNVDINDIRKGIVPEFPKDPPPEMIGGYSAKSRLVRKDPEFPPFIKVTRKDLARNHKLTDKEITEYMNDIKLINDYIKKNPAELVYVMTRYPKDDPRLAQLNFKMDQMKAASDEYMDTHFPENQKLFVKLQDKIIRNINQTDPKNFTGHKDAPKFVETDITEEERRRKTIARHFKKKK